MLRYEYELKRANITKMKYYVNTNNKYSANSPTTPTIAPSRSPLPNGQTYQPTLNPVSTIIEAGWSSFLRHTYNNNLVQFYVKYTRNVEINQF